MAYQLYKLYELELKNTNLNMIWYGHIYLTYE